MQNFQNNLQTKYEDQLFYLLSILWTYDLSEACVQGTLLKNVSLYTRVKDSEIGLWKPHVKVLLNLQKKTVWHTGNQGSLLIESPGIIDGIYIKYKDFQ